MMQIAGQTEGGVQLPALGWISVCQMEARRQINGDAMQSAELRPEPGCIFRSTIRDNVTGDIIWALCSLAQLYLWQMEDMAKEGSEPS